MSNNTEMNEVRDMMKFLGINERPITIYRAQIDYRCDQGYNIWLQQYKKQLQEACEKQLADDYMKNLGSNLFKERFHYFHEFQR